MRQPASPPPRPEAGHAWHAAGRPRAWRFAHETAAHRHDAAVGDAALFSDRAWLVVPASGLQQGTTNLVTGVGFVLTAGTPAVSTRCHPRAMKPLVGWRSVIRLRREAQALPSRDEPRDGIEVCGDRPGPSAAPSPVHRCLGACAGRRGRCRGGRAWCRLTSGLNFVTFPRPRQRVGKDEQQVALAAHAQRGVDRFLLVGDDRDRRPARRASSAARGRSCSGTSSPSRPRSESSRRQTVVEAAGHRLGDRFDVLVAPVARPGDDDDAPSGHVQALRQVGHRGHGVGVVRVVEDDLERCSSKSRSCAPAPGRTCCRRCAGSGGSRRA